MKILVTGSTSQQANPDAHRKSANFTGLLWQALREDPHHEVHWRDPSVTWTAADLREYDRVFVGVAAPLAMGANRAYGALSVAGALWGDTRLSLVVDQPDPDLITRGLRSVLANPDSFTKPFFSYRKEYDLAREKKTNGRLREALGLLLEDEWPRTVVPGLPWSEPSQIEARLPEGASGKVVTASFDEILLGRFWENGAPALPRLRAWAHEKTADYRWLQAQNLGAPLRELPANHRLETDSACAQQLRESMGLLVPPVRGLAWWTPKVAMAVALGAPVFTDWQKSARAGLAWAGLPATHEALGPGDAAEAAAHQRASFEAVTPDPADELKRIMKATRKAGASAAGKKRTA